MKNWLKSSIGSSVLILLIGLILAIAYVALIAGPSRAYEREDRYALEAMMKAKGYKQAQILNRFSYDEVYYIARVNHQNETFIVWFKDDLSKIVKSDNLNFNAMKPILSELSLDDKNVNFGVYKDELVYVVKNKTFEIFYDTTTLEKVFEFGGTS